MIRFRNRINENYFIDPETAIITDKNGVKQETTIRDGYFYFKGEPVHRIQMYTHIGIKPLLHIHHIDKNKLNNSLSNLIYLTKAEHMKIHYPNGIPHEMTEEERYKHGNAFRGKKFTEEHKKKISESNIGKHNHTEESKAKIRAKIKGKIICNNGIKNIYADKDNIPEGFVKGRLKKQPKN